MNRLLLQCSNSTGMPARSKRRLRRDAVSCRPGAAFPSAGHPVPIRARAIHGALVAAPGRQDTAHIDVGIGASVEARGSGVMFATALDLLLLMKPCQRIAHAASRPAGAESMP